MKISIVNVKEAISEAWRWDFYLGRENKKYTPLGKSCLANPFTIKKESDREESISQYDDWLFEKCQVIRLISIKLKRNLMILN